MKTFAKKLILASNSPRRREILKKFGFEFEIVKSVYREDKSEQFSIENIKKNSLGKALDAAQRIDFDAIVIGADTMVILDSVCLNKPQDISEAIFMLKNLSAKTHFVITAISLADTKSGKNLVKFDKTYVTFRELSEDEIINYIKTKNPLDKAGSYGIQDFIQADYVKIPESSFISEIKGDYYNVMGINPKLLNDMLKSF